MQPDHRTFQPARKLGLPTSPACTVTRPRRDAPFMEGHSRIQSQPILFVPIRPLRPRRHITPESISVSTGTAHAPKFNSRLSPRHVGPTCSRPLATHQSSTSVTSESSTSSISSQGRMKGTLSQRSSLTSLEDEPEEPKELIGTLQTKSPHPREVPGLQHNSGSPSISGGNRILDHTSAAVSVLKVNMTKAWTPIINASEEEEISHGYDSHLVRVMKAYHLAKASHPSDLPDWLFDERERMPSLSPRFTKSPRGIVSGVPSPDTSFPHSCHEAASRTLQHSRRALYGRPSGKTGPSKVGDRLKTFTEANCANFGGHVSSKSKSLFYPLSRVHTGMDAYHGANQAADPTRQPLRPGAF